MSQIILNDEQVKAVVGATEMVEVCDPKGRVLGILSRGFDAAEIAAAKRALASSGPRYSTEQVLDHLRTLENK